MKKIFLTTFLIIVFTSVFVSAGVSEENGCDESIIFSTVEISVGSANDSLAAYQIDITYDKEKVKILGLEGGTEGFNEPPFYDRAGFEGGRIIIAAYVDNDSNAKKGMTRVARIHLQTKGCPSCPLKTTMMAAAKPGGKEIPVEIEVSLLER